MISRFKTTFLMLFVSAPVWAQPAEPESQPTEVTTETPTVTEPEATVQAEKPEPKPTFEAIPVQVEPSKTVVVKKEADVAEKTDTPDRHRFVFGSYGRVVMSSDLEGGSGQNSDLVAFSPRVDESNYVELELRREDDFNPGSTDIVATLALSGPLFHYDGEFDERIAIRNLYAQFKASGTLDGFKLWAGSRMVRGDDIYLLDFWPLDNLNLLGGGTGYDFAPWVKADVSVGLARVNDPFQLQTDLVTPRTGFGAQTVTIVDRPRTVVAGKATGFPLGRDTLGLKVVAYGENHHLAGATGLDANDRPVVLPRQSGQVLGGQLGFWWADYNLFANVFARYATNLATVDPLAVPFQDGPIRSLEGARQTTLGFSLNAEYALLGLQAGGYIRSRRDGEENAFEASRSSEGVVSIRPHVWIGDYVGVAADVSYQALRLNTLDEVTAVPLKGSATKFAFMPFLSPAGRGTYTRPHIRLIYSLTTRSEDSRLLFPEDDLRAQKDTDHFFGIGAEWWFESSSYE